MQQTGKGQAPEDIAGALDRIDQVLATASASAADPSLLGRVVIDPAVLQVLTEYEEHRLLESIRERKNLFLVKALFTFAEFESGIRSLTESLKQRGEIICTLPTAGAGGDGIGFTIMVGSAEGRMPCRRRSAGPTPPSRRSSAPTKERLRRPVHETATLKTVSNTVRVDIHKLDGLMGSVGELHIIKGEIARIAADLRALQGFTGLAVNLSKAHKNLERRLNELQEGILRVMLVSGVSMLPSSRFA